MSVNPAKPRSPLEGDTPSIMRDGFKVKASDWREQEPIILARATYDLRCKDLDLTILAMGSENMTATFRLWDDEVATVGASGCERQATYVRGPQGWMMNGAIGDTGERRP